MNLHPDLLASLVALGVTEPELETLRSRMMSAVTMLEAQLAALNSQIDTLTTQRDAVQAELNQAYVTVGKLVAEE